MGAQLSFEEEKFFNVLKSNKPLPNNNNFINIINNTSANNNNNNKIDSNKAISSPLYPTDSLTSTKAFGLATVASSNLNLLSSSLPTSSWIFINNGLITIANNANYNGTDKKKKGDSFLQQSYSNILKQQVRDIISCEISTAGTRRAELTQHTIVLLTNALCNGTGVPQLYTNINGGNNVGSVITSDEDKVFVGGINEVNKGNNNRNSPQNNQTSSYLKKFINKAFYYNDDDNKEKVDIIKNNNNDDKNDNIHSTRKLSNLSSDGLNERVSADNSNNFNNMYNKQDKNSLNLPGTKSPSLTPYSTPFSVSSTPPLYLPPTSSLSQLSSDTLMNVLPAALALCRVVIKTLLELHNLRQHHSNQHPWHQREQAQSRQPLDQLNDNGSLFISAGVNIEGNTDRSIVFSGDGDNNNNLEKNNNIYREGNLPSYSVDFLRSDNSVSVQLTDRLVILCCDYITRIKVTAETIRTHIECINLLLVVCSTALYWCTPTAKHAQEQQNSLKNYQNLKKDKNKHTTIDDRNNGIITPDEDNVDSKVDSNSNNRINKRMVSSSVSPSQIILPSFTDHFTELILTSYYVNSIVITLLMRIESIIEDPFLCGNKSDNNKYNGNINPLKGGGSNKKKNYLSLLPFSSYGNNNNNGNSNVSSNNYVSVGISNRVSNSSSSCSNITSKSGSDHYTIRPLLIPDTFYQVTTPNVYNSLFRNYNSSNNNSSGVVTGIGNNGCCLQTWRVSSSDSLLNVSIQFLMILLFYKKNDSNASFSCDKLSKNNKKNPALSVFISLKDQKPINYINITRAITVLSAPALHPLMLSLLYLFVYEHPNYRKVMLGTGAVTVTSRPTSSAASVLHKSDQSNENHRSEDEDKSGDKIDVNSLTTSVHGRGSALDSGSVNGSCSLKMAVAQNLMITLLRCLFQSCVSIREDWRVAAAISASSPAVSANSSRDNNNLSVNRSVELNNLIYLMNNKPAVPPSAALFVHPNQELASINSATKVAYCFIFHLTVTLITILSQELTINSAFFSKWGKNSTNALIKNRKEWDWVTVGGNGGIGGGTCNSNYYDYNSCYYHNRGNNSGVAPEGFNNPGNGLVGNIASYFGSIFNILGGSSENNGGLLTVGTGVINNNNTGGGSLVISTGGGCPVVITNLGSLWVLVLSKCVVRAITKRYFTAVEMLVASLMNVAPFFHQVDGGASQRLVQLLCFCTKRFSRIGTENVLLRKLLYSLVPEIDKRKTYSFVGAFDAGNMNKEEKGKNNALEDDNNNVNEKDGNRDKNSNNILSPSDNSSTGGGVIAPVFNPSQKPVNCNIIANKDTISTPVERNDVGYYCKESKGEKTSIPVVKAKDNGVESDNNSSNNFKINSNISSEAGSIENNKSANIDHACYRKYLIIMNELKNNKIEVDALLTTVTGVCDVIAAAISTAEDKQNYALFYELLYNKQVLAISPVYKPNRSFVAKFFSPFFINDMKKLVKTPVKTSSVDNKVHNKDAKDICDGGDNNDSIKNDEDDDRREGQDNINNLITEVFHSVSTGDIEKYNFEMVCVTKKVLKPLLALIKQVEKELVLISPSYSSPETMDSSSFSSPSSIFTHEQILEIIKKIVSLNWSFLKEYDDTSADDNTEEETDSPKEEKKEGKEEEGKAEKTVNERDIKNNLCDGEVSIVRKEKKGSHLTQIETSSTSIPSKPNPTGNSKDPAFPKTGSIVKADKTPLALRPPPRCLELVYKYSESPDSYLFFTPLIWSIIVASEGYGKLYWSEDPANTFPLLKATKDEFFIEQLSIPSSPSAPSSSYLS